MKTGVLIRGISIVLLLALFCSVIYAVPSVPTSPQRVSPLNTSRFDETNWAAKSLEAEAGNITRLALTSLTQTQTWQGYFGEITGTITLDDNNNFTLYDWYAAEPQGEIYAASQEVTNWVTAHCFNYTNNGSAMFYYYDNNTKNTTTNVTLNLTELESGSLDWSLGLSPGDYDGVNETFRETGMVVWKRNATGEYYEPHLPFYVGTTYIIAGSCPATDTYEVHCVNKTDPDEQDQLKVADYFCNGSSQFSGTNGTYAWDGTEDGSNFQEVLLTVNNSETIIYTTIIESNDTDDRSDPWGFNNETHDFQMIVGDDGHGGAGQDTTTTYYFYVELE